MADPVINSQRSADDAPLNIREASSGSASADAGVWGPPTTAAAGWYPLGPNGALRYFDGQAWDPSPAPPGYAPAWPMGSSPIPPKVPHRTLPLVAGLAIYALLVGGLIIADLLFSAIDPWLNSVAWALAALVALLAIGEGPALWWASYVRRRWGDGTWASIGWKWSWTDIGWGALTWLIGVLVIVAVRSLLLALKIPTASNLTVDSTRSPSVMGRIVFVVLLVVVAPLTEELIFRGVMLRSFLSRMHPVVAIGLQGVLFGSAHYSPHFGTGNVGLILVLSSFGCVLGVIAYVRYTIGATIVAHAIFNAIAAIAFFATQ